MIAELKHAFTTRYPSPDPRGQVDAADHQGDEDGRRVEAAPGAGADAAGAAVRLADAARAEQPGVARRSVDAPAARRARRRRRPAARCCCSSSPPIAACAAASTPTSSSRRASSSPRIAGREVALGLVGRRGRDFFARRGFEVRYEQVNLFAKVKLRGRARRSRRPAMEAFLNGEVDSVYLVYNEFKSVMVQRVVGRAAAADPAARHRRRAGRHRAADRLPLRAGAGAAVRRTLHPDATSRSRCSARCSNRTPRSTPRR